VYTAQRAAALSGVPKSTVYYWSTHDVLEPSLSRSRPKLWTYTDVVGLRIIYWLRRNKPEADRSTMKSVRRALAGIERVGEELGSPSTRVAVNRLGNVFISHAASDERAAEWVEAITGMAQSQANLWGAFDPLVEYDSDAGPVGPDLREPRPLLRIIPGKLGGEPHIDGTRIGSLTIAGLVDEGWSLSNVVALYPGLTTDAVEQCIDLERQLARNAA
jgi:uncharacterized protein (DUF433 family)